MTRAMPIVLLHGFAGVPADWSEVRAGLAHATVRAPALLGHEPSAITADTFEAEVDRVAAMLATDAPVHLVGYSLGGRIALGVLARHGTLVARATVVAASPGLTTTEQRRARVEADERWARMLETRGAAAFLDAWDAQPLFATRARADDARLAARRSLRLAHDARGLARAVRVLGLGRMPCWLEALGSIACPVAFVAGADDDRFVATAEQMARRAPHASLHVVEHAGHDVTFERPSAVAEIIRRGESR